MDPTLVPQFATWLEQAYSGDFDALTSAWHFNTIMAVPGPASGAPANWTDAAASLVGTGGPTAPGWQGLYATSSFAFTPWIQAGTQNDWARYRDAMMFFASLTAAEAARQANWSLSYEPSAPFRVGGETMLLDNQPQNGWNRAFMAGVARWAGGYYDSMHLPWHYTLASSRARSPQDLQQPAYSYRVDMPLYLMAREIVDGSRGQWSGTFESSGGPAQLSGAQPGTINAGQIRRMMLGYIAAGMRGVGMWCWNARWYGQEGGEYALTDLQGRPGPRAQAAGAIAAALQVHRFDLWDAVDQPVVAVLYSWESEALYARAGYASGPVISCTVAGCSDFRSQVPWYGVKARVGVAAALTARGIPWQWVTDADLVAWGGNATYAQHGFAALVLPGIIGINSTELLPVLADYVQAGGRLIADQPFLLYDTPRAELLDHTTSGVSTLFGAYVQTLQNSANGYVHAIRVASDQVLPVSGMYADIGLDGGTPTMEDAQLQPDAQPFISSVSKSTGAGQAVLINAEVGKLAFAEEAPNALAVDNTSPMSGLGLAAEYLARIITNDYALLGSGRVGWTLAASLGSGPLVPAGILAFRRTSSAADFYMVMNEQTVNATLTLNVVDRADYTGPAVDAITGEPLQCTGAGSPQFMCALAVAAHDGLWIRVDRAA